MNYRVLFLILLLAFSCSEENSDPCELLVCENGGQCENGACTCAEGYTGATCSDQTTPKKIFINKIIFLKWPNASPSGESWDPDSGPDLYLIFRNAVNGTIYEMEQNIVNVTSGYKYPFEFSTPVVIKTPTALTTLKLFDYDELGGSVLMSETSFVATEMIDGFPSELVVTSSSGDTSFKVYITYEF